MHTLRKITLVVLLAVCGVFALVRSMSLAQDARVIAYGETVNGDVTNRFGEEWTFRGCGSDVVTITLRSDAFSPYLELYSPTRQDFLTNTNEAETGALAQIAAQPLDANGTYTVVAAGVNVRDQGPYSLTLALANAASADLGGADGIVAGQPVTGEVTNRFGDEQVFRGCANSVVTITLESVEFVPSVELFGPVGRDPLAVGRREPTGRGQANRIRAFTLPDTGIYTLIAAGESVRDRGPYTLTLTLQDSLALTSALTSTETITAAVPATATATNTPLPTATGPLCTVTSSSLNLRSGPGQIFGPPIGSLRQGTQLRPFARDAAADWIQVEVVGTGRVGWVSAGDSFVTCNIDVRTLPLGDIPPLPTATFTPSPAPTATPTPTPIVQLPPALQPVGLLIQAPGNKGDLVGDVFTNGNFVVSGSNARDETLIVRDRLYLELFVRDPRAGNNDGDGIDRVEFSIDCPNGVQYTRTERTPRYCSFGGGEPDCNVISLELGQNFPDSACVVADYEYFVSITAFPTNENRDSGNWNFWMRPQVEGVPAEPPPDNPPADLVAYVAQIGPGSVDSFVNNALAFQVAAFDPSVGSDDGAGIDHVDFLISGPSGPVYSHRENTAGYCAFGGGEPDCNVFYLAENDYWPDNGPAIENGPHTLHAVVYAGDGRTMAVDANIDIQVGQ